MLLLMFPGLGRGTEFFGCAVVNHEGCEALPRWEIMQGNA